MTERRAPPAPTLPPLSSTNDKPPLLDQRLVRSLGHPIRVAALDLLTEGVFSPKQLSKLLPKPLSHVSYHVRILEENDAIELVHQERRRGAVEHFFRATSESFIGSPGWRQVPKLFLGVVAGASLQSFIDKATAALVAGKLDDDRSAFVWMPIVVDDRGREEVAEVRESAIVDLLAVQAKSKRRLARGTGKGESQYLVGVAGFEAVGCGSG